MTYDPAVRAQIRQPMNEPNRRERGRNHSLHRENDQGRLKVGKIERCEAMQVSVDFGTAPEVILLCYIKLTILSYWNFLHGII